MITFFEQASHCLYGFTDIDLYGGILDSSTGPANFYASITDPAHKIIHEGYNDDLLLNDVGLVYLANAPSNLFDHPYIGRIALACADENPLPGTIVTPSGFGRYNDTTSSQILRYTTAPIITNTQCANVFGSYVTAGNICIDTTGCRSTCSGDSGK
jgi:Trypsin